MGATRAGRGSTAAQDSWGSANAVPERIPVVVRGALGRVGQQLVSTLSQQDDIALVGAVDVAAQESTLAPDGAAPIPLSRDVSLLLDAVRPQVLVDFTAPRAAMEGARAAIQRGCHLVMGTTGLSEANLEEIERSCRMAGTGAIVAPNFAIGAVLMMHLARIAARYFEYAEVIELHHEGKLDAPSGTAKATAEQIAAARGARFQRNVPRDETVPGTRGGELGGVSIHSVRLPGLVAHQEVLFGALGQTLSIRHDTVSREAFMPGVLTAIRRIGGQRGLVRGLEALMELS